MIGEGTWLPISVKRLIGFFLVIWMLLVVNIVHVIWLNTMLIAVKMSVSGGDNRLLLFRVLNENVLVLFERCWLEEIIFMPPLYVLLEMLCFWHVHPDVCARVETFSGSLLSTFHLVLILFGRLCLVALCTLLWPCIYRFYIWRHCSCACDIGHSHNGIMTLLVDFTIHLTTGVEWLVLAIAELVFTSSVQRTLQFVDI